MTIDDRAEEPELWDFLVRRHVLIDRHISAGTLADKTSPVEGITFLTEMGETVVPYLLDLCHKHSSKRSNWPGLYRTQTVALNDAKTQITALKRQIAEFGEDNPHEVTSLRKKLHKCQDILLGIAQQQYDYDPKALRSGAAKQIADDCLEEGVSVSPYTIRNNLREAADRY